MTDLVMREDQLIINSVLLLLQTYYPSNSKHGPVLLASYVWESEAEKFNSLSRSECIDKVSPPTPQISQQGYFSKVPKSHYHS